MAEEKSKFSLALSFHDDVFISERLQILEHNDRIMMEEIQRSIGSNPLSTSQILEHTDRVVMEEIQRSIGGNSLPTNQILNYTDRVVMEAIQSEVNFMSSPIAFVSDETYYTNKIPYLKLELLELKKEPKTRFELAIDEEDV